MFALLRDILNDTVYAKQMEILNASIFDLITCVCTPCLVGLDKLMAM
jgi:hypothetical protein